MKQVKAEDLKVGDIFYTGPAEFYISYEVLNINDNEIKLLNIDYLIETESTFVKLDYLWDYLYIKENIPEKIEPRKSLNTCNHATKYKNHAGGILFWYCPTCKTDLGNV